MNADFNWVTYRIQLEQNFQEVIPEGPTKVFEEGKLVNQQTDKSGLGKILWILWALFFSDYIIFLLFFIEEG